MPLFRHRSCCLIIRWTDFPHKTTCTIDHIQMLQMVEDEFYAFLIDPDLSCLDMRVHLNTRQSTQGAVHRFRTECEYVSILPSVSGFEPASRNRSHFHFHFCCLSSIYLIRLMVSDCKLTRSSYLSRPRDRCKFLARLIPRYSVEEMTLFRGTHTVAEALMSLCR